MDSYDMHLPINSLFMYLNCNSAFLVLFHFLKQNFQLIFVFEEYFMYVDHHVANLHCLKLTDQYQMFMLMVYGIFH